MSFINIDEIIKKALQESERQNILLGNLSKEMVWKAIEKPKKRKSLHWALVTAMAASVSLLLISVFLFYKLDLKQKELDALKTNRVKPPVEFHIVRPLTGETGADRVDRKSEEFPGPIQADGKEQIHPLDHEPNLAEKADEKANERQLIPLPIIETIVMDFNPAITIPKIDPLELKKGLLLSEPSDDEIASATKSNKQGKLKIRIGNGSPFPSHHHTPALNLKL